MLVKDLLEMRVLFTGEKIVRKVRKVLYIFRHGVDDREVGWDDGDPRQKAGRVVSVGFNA